RVDVEGDYARCSRPGCREGEDTRSRSHVGHAFARQVYIREEVCEEFAREKVSGVEHCRSHRETESGYARHRCPAAREDKMIGQEVNGRTQKLLRAARRKRGTVESAGSADRQDCESARRQRRGVRRHRLKSKRKPRW